MIWFHTTTTTDGRTIHYGYDPNDPSTASVKVLVAKSFAE